MPISEAGRQYLETLSTTGEAIFQASSLRDIPAVLHDEHRWTLPAVWLAQERGLVPRPCLLIVFDSHHDAVSPRSGLERLHAFLRSPTQNLAGALELGETALSILNDDWICASMELGLVGDAIVVGVEDRRDAPESYTDAQGVGHRIFYLAHPSSAFAYQGYLSDLAYRVERQPLWETLGWHRPPGEEVFQFAKGLAPVVLSIDLDCYRMSWDGYEMPWPRRVFEDRYLRPADYFSTAGWTGQRFVQGLLERTALLDIALEPKHCGGRQNSLRILSQLQRIVFGERLAVPT